MSRMCTRRTNGHLRFFLFCFSSAWLGSSSFSLIFMLGPIATAFITKFGCCVAMVTGGVLFGLGLFSSSFVGNIHQLYATYTLVLPLGACLCYCTSILVLNQHFTRRLVLANGITLAGNGVGTLTLAPLMNTLLDGVHWRQTLRVLSALSIVLVACGLAYYVVSPQARLESQDASETGTNAKLIDWSLFRNKAFSVWVLSASLVMFSYYIPFVHLVSEARHCPTPPRRVSPSHQSLPSPRLPPAHTT